MGETPTTVNKAVQTVDQIINAAVFDVGVNAAEAALKIEFPFLAFPGLSQLLDFALRFLAKYVYTGLANFATIQIINFQTNAEKYVYNQAEAKLRLAHLSGDPAKLAEATAEFKKAFQSLVHYDGSASP